MNVVTRLPGPFDDRETHEGTVRISSDGIFYTLQGEGPFVGTPSVFVRLDTCNLRCKWGDTLCDAFYTSWTPGSVRIDLDELVRRVSEVLFGRRCTHLVITGGEPTLQVDAVVRLSQMAWECGVHSTLETNGTIFIPQAKIDLVCLSPKLSSSTPVGTKYQRLHEKNRWVPQVVREWIRPHPHRKYFFKFVIDRASDVVEVLTMLKEVEQSLPDPEHVVFMPQGVDPEELAVRSGWLADQCKQLGVRYSPRLQIQLWGNTPGT